ncbi:MAG: hypothetical protein IKV63_07530 [Clostridia bacterium]|nr:hypothetical protein [Clostridia bacterium]
MGKEVRRTICLMTGVILCLFIILSDNFSFVLGPSMQSKLLMLLQIMLPKLAFGAVMGAGFWAVLPLSDKKDGFFALFTPVVTIFIYQVIELIFKWGAIVDLLSMPGTRGTYYSLSVWIFIITLAFLDYLFFDNEKLSRFAGDLLIICVITLIFCGCDLILPVFINSRFLVGFQIGGYFIVRGIYNGPKN